MGAPNCMNINTRKWDSRTDKKIIRGITKAALMTVDGQKIIMGITKADLMTVDRLKIIRGNTKADLTRVNRQKKL